MSRYGRLVQKRVNREPSGDIEEPNCLECARVSHTVIIRGTQQRPHGIYVPHCQSHCDPRDSLIINSNLNLTSNADPRDNIVVAISTQKSPLQMSERSCFPSASPLPSSPSHLSSITGTPAACRTSSVFSLEKTPSCLQLLMECGKQLKELLTQRSGLHLHSSRTGEDLLSVPSTFAL